MNLGQLGEKPECFPCALQAPNFQILLTNLSGDQPVFQFVEGEDGELLISIPISSTPKKLPQYYCFATGRHSGSFFLKSGAALFCLGHIIHIVLNLIRQVGYL